MRELMTSQLAVSVYILGVFLATPGHAVLKPVPEESGFGGSVSLGAAYMEARTNMVAGNGSLSIGDRTISSVFASPDTDSQMVPLIGGEIRYTFGDSRTQIYLGGRREDFLPFESGMLLGVRQELGDRGTGEISYIADGMATEVWKDPYVANARRSKTDLTSKGIRLEWDRIWGTDIGAEYQARKIEIDDELSGTLGGLGLTPSEIGLLDREGDRRSGAVYYTWRLGGGQSLVPALCFARSDRDGGAMSSNLYALKLSYALRREKYSIFVTGRVGREGFDKTNPIYAKTREDDIYGMGVTGMLHQPFGWPKGVSLAGTAGYYAADSNISFYDTRVVTLGASVLYEF